MYAVPVYDSMHDLFGNIPNKSCACNQCTLNDEITLAYFGIAFCANEFYRLNRSIFLLALIG